MPPRRHLSGLQRAKAAAAATRTKPVPPPFEESTLFPLPVIGRAIEVDADALRKWFADGGQGGGLALMPPHDRPAGTGGRSHALHWRTAVTLMLAVRLNTIGLRLRGGEAAKAAAAVFAGGLDFEHLFSEARPLIAVVMRPGHVDVALVRRDALAGYIESKVAVEDGFPCIGTILMDPASFGVILTTIAGEAA